MTDDSIELDATNSLSITQNEITVTVKTPVDPKAVDYWTLTHYKSAKIANVTPKDR
jgi:hypothetical protein